MREEEAVGGSGKPWGCVGRREPGAPETDGSGAPGDPARRARPRVRSACGWWPLVVWSLRLASGGLCAPRTRGRLQCLQVSVFANRSWARTDGLARLEELQVDGWRNGSDSIRFLKPWARGPFGEGQWDELQRLLSVYRGSFTRDMHEFVKMLRLDYPFGVQVSAGCELRPGNTSESFFHAAFQGKEIMSFQGTVWMPAPDAPYWVGRATKELNQDQGTRKTLQWLLNDTCPQFVRGLLEAGKSELEKQEGSHSSMWLMLVALLGSLLMIGCLALWYRRHRSYQGIL
ncbi:antigen-presenting glycoprotein CD1d [Callorhinus ursinus]|uniref:antigen-presenting glycoprotein CD1d n=1 Tax=Callorhinus ursinus TaxID=34884 RepID=UPI003CD04B65